MADPIRPQLEELGAADLVRRVEALEKLVESKEKKK